MKNGRINTRWPDCPGNKERVVNCNRSHNGSTHFEGNAKGLCIPLLESVSNLIMKQILEYLLINTGVSWIKIKNIIYFFWNANYSRKIYIHNPCTCTYIDTQTYTHMHLCIHIHTCICIHIHTTHKYIYTFTHKNI